MENLHFDRTNNTPQIACDNSTNTISIEGESRPENVRAFYSALFAWVDEYEKSLFHQSSLSTNEKAITLNFKLTYFNSSSLKIFMDIIEKLSKTAKNIPQTKLTINWFYESDDEDMLESGKEFEKMTGKEMIFIEIN